MRTAVGCLLVGLAVLAVPSAAFAQDDDNAPPYISGVEWRIVRNTTGVSFGFFPDWVLLDMSEPFDPLVDIAFELDVLFATLTIVDPDWEGEDDEEGSDEAVYIRFLAWWWPYPGYNTPEGPPIIEADEDYFPEEGDGLSPGPGETELLLTLRVTIPEFEGKNQARLRGLIDYDVAWLIEFCVSNEQSPADEDPVFCWGDFIYALENPVLGPANAPPFADAAADQIVEAGDTVILDATRTFDSFNVGFDPANEDVLEKDAIIYAWEWISGPVRVDPEQDSQTDPQARVTLATLGIYTYRVTVSDGANPGVNSASTTIQVVSEIPGNRLPTAVVSGPTSVVTIGDVITLDGSNSKDPDNDPLTYLWRQTDELGGILPPEQLNRVFQPISGREAAISTWQAVQVGTFYVRLLVGDGQLSDISDEPGAPVPFSIDVVEPETAGVTGVNQGAAPPASGETTPTALPCGAGLFPLALVPLMLWPMRGRIR